MMGRVSEPEVPRSASGTCAKTAKTLHPQHFGAAAASQDRQERVNVAAGVQAIVGAVTRRSHEGAFPENQDQPYGTEHPKTQEPATDAPVWREEAGRLALSEASRQGADTLSAARRRSRQRRTQG